MRKLIIGLLIVFLTACSSQGSSESSGGSEFESDMRSAYDLINKAFEEDLREFTDKEKDQLSHLLYSKEHDIEIGTDEYSFYQAVQKYETYYSGYQSRTTEYEELLDVQSNAEQYFE